MGNIIHDMDALHMQQVWDELADRFHFPEKKWKEKFKEYADKQPSTVGERGIFLTFGTKHIDPVLNQLLLRPPASQTFNALVEYVIKKSSSYQKKEAQRGRNAGNVK